MLITEPGTAVRTAGAEEPALLAEHVEPRLLGHWGATPGLNLLYAHVNRIIAQRDLDVLCVVVPGHGALPEEWLRANPRANGGRLLRELSVPDFRDHAVPVERPASESSEATRVPGGFPRDVVAANTDRAWDAAVLPGDENPVPDGRVLEVLSEHLCQGWSEGCLLMGRHGLVTCYEAFIHVVDSMLDQHAKWLKAACAVLWRAPLASLDYLLPSRAWRQDHSGFSHRVPGRDFDALFTTDKPVVFAFHGYKEEGATTTPFDVVVPNDLDRLHLVMDVVDRVPAPRGNASALRQETVDRRGAARRHTREHGEDDPEISGWTWRAAS